MQKTVLFQGVWVREEGCREVVEKSWNSQFVGNWAVKWRRKLDMTRNNLKQWSKEMFHGRRPLINNLTEQLESLQMDWKTNVDQIKDIMTQIHRLKEHEELY